MQSNEKTADYIDIRKGFLLDGVPVDNTIARIISKIALSNSGSVI